MHGKSILGLLAVVLTVSQVTWARCVCDPADTICLDNCVNSARDCIEGCSGVSGDSCYTGCINVHWPGATFEDLDNEDITQKPTPTSRDRPTAKPAVTPTTTPTTAAVGPAVDDILPYLISFFGGMIPTQLGSIPGQLSTLPIGGLPPLSGAVPSQLPTGGIPTAMSSGVQTTGIASASLSAFPINTVGPSLMTTHTTVTSLVTITPNPTDASSNISSHGLKSLVDPQIFLVAGTILLASTLILV